MTDTSWYEDGLRFSCVQCGHCCGGGPGTVRVSEAEISALAARLELADAEFRKRYTRTLRGGDISLEEKPNDDCVFYDQNRGCTVYEDRPQQCRTWPFWSSVVHSPDTWAAEAETCPGMNSGALHSAAGIAETISNDGTSNASDERRR